MFCIKNKDINIEMFCIKNKDINIEMFCIKNKDINIEMFCIKNKDINIEMFCIKNKDIDYIKFSSHENTILSWFVIEVVIHKWCIIMHKTHTFLTVHGVVTSIMFCLAITV